ncbi:LuxR family transcriptional regulator [Streptomyces sp. NPDC001795]|uniref:helix-turn-helix transcriptional regulator n=1 Tax=unclassified Streptomyces TaxID=2593676 RepID=UPI00331C4B64
MDGDHAALRRAADGLVGRAGEVALLLSFVGEAVSSGGFLLLSGEPGVGKSVLLDVAAKAASAAGALVLRSDGVEFLADLSFSALKHVLMPLQREFDGLGSVHRDALEVALGIREGAAVDHLVVYGAALALLRRAAQARPLLLIVDDLQWVDRASAAALAFVARRLAGSRVGFLAARRPGIEKFFDRAGLPELEIRPLDGEAAAGLVGTRFPLLGARALRRVLAQAQGNPLALLELPATLTDQQHASVGAPSGVLPLSRRLQDLYASRVEELPAPTRRLLLLAALEGTGDLRVLRAAGGEDALVDLAPAERAQLVQVAEGGPGRLTFRHPLVRATVVGGSPSGERLGAHRALARVLAGQPDRRAWHLAEATADPDEHVAALLEQTAHRARRRGDAVGAFNALVRAADLSPDPADRGRRLAEAVYVGSDVAGELRTAARLLVEVRRADPELRGSVQAAVAASHVLLHRDGDVRTAHRLLVGAITGRAGRSDGGDDGALFDALRTLLRVCVYGGTPELWDTYHAVMNQLTVRLPPFLELLVAVLADPARTTPQALARLDAAIDDLQWETDPTRIERIGMTALFMDRATRCRAALWRVVDDGREGGAVASAINALTVLCLDDFMTGQWDECARLVEEGLRLCELHGYQLLAWPFRLARALLAAARGDDATVRTLARQITAWAEPRGSRSMEHSARQASALAALGRGDYEDAYRNASAISPAGTLAHHVPEALWVPLDLVEAAVRTGRQAEARAHVTAMRQAGLAALSPRLALITTGSAALAASADGAGPDRADGLFEQALALPGVDRWPFELARVRLAYGEHLRRRHAVKESRIHLAAALDTFHHLGAAPWAARAADELRATGHITAWAHPWVRTSPLTAQEHRIAMLAATGMTNKQIGAELYLSHRTVAAHLHRIFPKLGITSRVTLGEALASLPRQEDHGR